MRFDDWIQHYNIKKNLRKAFEEGATARLRDEPIGSLYARNDYHSSYAHGYNAMDIWLEHNTILCDRCGRKVNECDSNITNKTLFRIMARFGWDSIWYANPFPATEPLIKSRSWYKNFSDQKPPNDDKKDRWMIGVWTGPQMDLICLKYCETNEEANIWLSPGGDTPFDAARKAVEKFEELNKI